MEATIRPATTDDLDGMLAVRAAVAAEGIWIATEAPLDLDRDRTNHTATIEAMEAGGDSILHVAVVGDEIVGTLVLIAGGGRGDIGMNLADGHRGRGLGTALMQAAIDHARERGLHKLELELWPWNRAARALYERCGFVEEGYRRRQYRRRDGSLWDSVVMGLVLDHDAPGHEERAEHPPR